MCLSLHSPPVMVDVILYAAVLMLSMDTWHTCTMDLLPLMSHMNCGGAT